MTDGNSGESRAEGSEVTDDGEASHLADGIAADSRFVDDPPSDDSPIGEEELDEVELVEAGPPKRRIYRVLLVLAAVMLGFRAALFVQQISMTIAMHLLGCPDAGYDLSGLGGGRAVGIDSCPSDAVLSAGLIGIFIDLLVALPLLILLQRGHRPRHRFVGLFVYFCAIGALSEVISGSIVYVFFDSFETANLLAWGVPWWSLVLVGIIIIGACIKPIHGTTHYFATELLKQPEEHVPIFQKAIWVKLSVGVLLISFMRILISS